MASNLVFEAPQGKGKVLLFGGLDWRLLPATGNVAGHLREIAKDRSASNAAQVIGLQPEEITVDGKHKQVHRTTAGFFTSSDNRAPPKGAHSLAAAFSAWTSEHTSALLNVKLADDRHAVVVVINGIPVIDKIEVNGHAAFDLALPYQKDRPEIAVFSNDVEVYPNALEHEEVLESISEWVSKDTAIRPIPLDVVKVSAFVLVIAAIAGGWFFYQKWDAEQKRLAALEKQRAEDPIPKYLNALAAARQDVGIDRESIKAAIGYAQQIPLAPEGWNASRVGCVQGGGCEVTMARSTGTFASLTKAVPMLALSPAGAVNLNEARLTWQQDLGTAKLDPATQLPQLGTFIQGPEASKLQDWLVAGLTIQLSPQQLWPQAEGVPPHFKHPEALATGKFEIDGIALPQLLEVVANAPANVNWTAWSVDLGDAKQEPLSRAKGRLTGNYYVKNN
ncbi:hypothetical protein J2W32_006485 [Variovorax boronicumulans]|uniref:Type 4b pilus protein PilO2 n=1 Tax=Variovorax boronicumulans TaxID=436515 RepID=A0AAW8D150_9BURK|nr:type 4b pilus protein PilO2 [Variovorax boronicumulans]MDP9897358.1 hypothetical protein [Variovorax boronicumulans]MDQ0057408.1 hypothetical protein [Variovorax boronicumulans]